MEKNNEGLKMHHLKPAPGSVKSNKRVGRGAGAGTGGTATRGHKGQKSRRGFSKKRNFEGGQMPLQMRVPKRGFKNPNRVSYVPFNVERLQAIAAKYQLDTINPEVLIEKNIINKKDRVKILGAGEISVKLNVTAHAYSSSARQAIEAAGGTTNQA